MIVGSFLFSVSYAAIAGQTRKPPNDTNSAIAATRRGDWNTSAMRRSLERKRQPVVRLSPESITILHLPVSVRVSTPVNLVNWRTDLLQHSHLML